MLQLLLYGNDENPSSLVHKLQHNQLFFLISILVNFFSGVGVASSLSSVVNYKFAERERLDLEVAARMFSS